MDFTIPRWLLRFVQEKRCIKCEQGICSKDVVAFGIRKVENGVLPYFEYFCPTCNNRSVAVVENDPRKKYTIFKFCYEILQERKNLRDLDRAKSQESISKGKMNDEEVEEFLKFVRLCKTHEEFMKKIGDYPLSDKKSNKNPCKGEEDGLWNEFPED